MVRYEGGRWGRKGEWEGMGEEEGKREASRSSLVRRDMEVNWTNEECVSIRYRQRVDMERAHRIERSRSCRAKRFLPFVVEVRVVEGGPAAPFALVLAVRGAAMIYYGLSLTSSSV